MTETATDTPKLVDRIKRLTEIPITQIDGFEKGNPKAPTQADRDILDASLDENGYVMPVMVREKRNNRYELIDGHTRVERIRARYGTEVPLKVLVIECESVEEGRKIILGLKNTADWDRDALDEWMREALKDGMDGDVAMRLSGMTAADLDSLAEFGANALENLHSLERTRVESGEEPKREQTSGGGIIHEVDIADALPVKTISKTGTVWTLGKSRLVVGDSTTPEVVRAALAGAKPDLIWTDPPWNVALDAANKPSGRSSKRKSNTTIANDSLGDGFPAFLGSVSKMLSEVSDGGTPIYVAMAMSELGVMDLSLKEHGWHWSSTIMWVKQALVLSRKDFHPQYEPIWYGWREGASRKCAPTDRAMSDVWTIDRPRKSELHPSMKPIALVARSIGASSKPGDLVLDTFAGSGTTLLAAEQLGRRSSLVELSPAYADIIVERWESLTGGKAQRNT